MYAPCILGLKRGQSLLKGMNVLAVIAVASLRDTPLPRVLQTRHGGGTQSLTSHAGS